MKALKATVGYFEADPNRVVGLVLTAYAANPTVTAYQQLLGLFTPELVTQTLGFILKHQAGPQGETAEGLLLVVAHLVKVLPWTLGPCHSLCMQKRTDIKPWIRYRSVGSGVWLGSPGGHPDGMHMQLSRGFRTLNPKWLHKLSPTYVYTHPLTYRPPPTHPPTHPVAAHILCYACPQIVGCGSCRSQGSLSWRTSSPTPRPRIRR